MCLACYDSTELDKFSMTGVIIAVVVIIRLILPFSRDPPDSEGGN